MPPRFNYKANTKKLTPQQRKEALARAKKKRPVRKKDFSNYPIKVMHMRIRRPDKIEED